MLVRVFRVKLYIKNWVLKLLSSFGFPKYFRYWLYVIHWNCELNLYISHFVYNKFFNSTNCVIISRTEEFPKFLELIDFSNLQHGGESKFLLWSCIWIVFTFLLLKRKFRDGYTLKGTKCGFNTVHSYSHGSRWYTYVSTSVIPNIL